MMPVAGALPAVSFGGAHAVTSARIQHSLLLLSTDLVADFEILGPESLK
jgi:hypothetical protein